MVMIIWWKATNVESLLGVDDVRLATLATAPTALCVGSCAHCAWEVVRGVNRTQSMKTAAALTEFTDSTAHLAHTSSGQLVTQLEGQHSISFEP